MNTFKSLCTKILPPPQQGQPVEKKEVQQGPTFAWTTFYKFNKDCGFWFGDSQNVKEVQVKQPDPKDLLL